MQECQLQERFAGRYSVVKTLGVGGMGRVLEVYDTVVGRTVALKVMRDEIRYRDSLARRFQREYSAMARLHHEGIPAVYDAGIDDAGRAYFTMEIIHAQSLTTALGEAVDPPRLLGVAAEVARILAAVHAAGIIHRDVKPSNILLGPDDRVHLVDFGTSHVTGALEEHFMSATGAPLRTAPGTWLGTPGYVDPAMLEGFPCSARSDVYSLAATIAWMFTRTQPSTDPHAPVPTTGVASVDRLLRLGMARLPQERPASMEEFRAKILTCRASLSLLPTAKDSDGVLCERKLAPGLVLALGVFGGVLGGPVGGVFVESRWPEECGQVDARVQPQALPLSFRQDEPQPESGEARQEELLSAPSVREGTPLGTPREKTTAEDRRARGAAKASQVVRKGSSWVDVLGTSRQSLRRCLEDSRGSVGMSRIAVVVDGPSGRFRDIDPIKTPGHIKRCLRKKLAGLKFMPFPERIELTLGLSAAPRPQTVQSAP